METSITVQANMPIMQVSEAVDRYRMMNSFVSEILRDGVDFGVIPGTGNKATLLKAGAEKLTTFFGLRPTFEIIEKTEDWTGDQHGGEPFFYYWFRCSLVRSGEIIAQGDGSCNSRETKYRYRKASRVCPSCGSDAIIKGRAEYGGGWLCYAKKGGCGAKFKDGDQSIEGQETGRIPNADIADQVNTIQKMAQKRALVAATLIGVNASDHFTQDMEDLPGYGEIIDVTPAPPRNETASGQALTAAMHADAEFDALPSAPKSASAKTTPAATNAAAGIDGAVTQEFNAWAITFATQHPYYSRDGSDGEVSANKFHILKAIGMEGFSKVTADNFVAVTAAMEARAISKEAEAAA